MKFGPLVINLFSGDLLFTYSKLGKNYAFELLLLGFRHNWSRHFDLDISISIDKEEDHAPYFKFHLFFLTLNIIEFNVYNVNHAEPEEKSAINWVWKEEIRTWEAHFPVKVNGKDGEWMVWMTQRPSYCDRGRWGVGVEGVGVNSPDDHEGFPRYFFNIDYAKEEMEQWVAIRSEIVRKETDPDAKRKTTDSSCA